MQYSLQPHPDTISNVVQSLDVEIGRSYESELFARFRVRVNRRNLKLPDRKWDSAGRESNLWENTCFEIFVRPLPGTAYYEFNFSPSTDWASYRFEDYRQAMMEADIVPSGIVDRRKLESYQLAARVEGLPVDCDWQIGVSAVIEDTDGYKSYWALAHPPGAPDFHHPDCFAATLVSQGAP